MIEDQLRGIVAGTGLMPTNSELQQMGRCDLSNQISRKGGFVFWANRIGATRTHSDSDTGWLGESEVSKILRDRGFEVFKPKGVKCPYDILVNGVVRIDVKSARYAEYGKHKGWFYRIGKMPQADIIALYQIDTGNCYILPWEICPKTNVTVARGGGKLERYINRYDLLSRLVETRKAEGAIWE